MRYVVAELIYQNGKMKMTLVVIEPTATMLAVAIPLGHESLKKIFTRDNNRTYSPLQLFICGQ